MGARSVTERLTETLGDRPVESRVRSDRRIDVVVEPRDLPETARRMLEALGARLQIATGVDVPPDAIEILYHFALDTDGAIVTVRTTLDRTSPEIDSITPFCPAAEWIEREIAELLGVRFAGHPDPRHLLLVDDWPEGSFPLRRDHHRGGAS